MNALHLARRARIDADDAAFGDAAGHDIAVQQPWRIELGRIRGGAGDFQWAVNPAARASDICI